MDKLILFNRLTVNTLFNTRTGESKFGEHVRLLSSTTNIYESVRDLDVKFVLIGLPEAVGVFANHGKSGTSKAWDATIKVLLNAQSNAYTRAQDVLILGALNFEAEQKALSTLDQSKAKDLQKARKLVDSIDREVSDLVFKIVTAGKIPILIGGGHNNAYGNIKGTSLALKREVNVVNFDAHTDFRVREGRHSGNGFSYAFAEGFLGKYFVFGLHENYNSQEVLNSFHEKKALEYSSYEAIEVRKELKFKAEMKRALNHVSSGPFGIEIDCDAIINIPSSAKTPSGFSVAQTRQFLHFFGQQEQVSYLHICEAAPSKKTAGQVGKLISYLITDFIRAQNGR